MPINYKDYPKNWKTEIRPAILQRANNCCEVCGVPNYTYGYRQKDGKFIAWTEIENALEMHGYDYFDDELKHHIKKDMTANKGTTIVLTIAHLDHDKHNHEVSLDRLKAMCQRCHLLYDMESHVANRKANNNKKKGIQTLF